MMVGTCILVFVAIYEIKPAVVELVNAKSVSISHPKIGDKVRLIEEIAGISNKRSGYIHILVRTPQGIEWTQDGRMQPNDRGEWRLKAQFGETDIGCGENFLVRPMWSPTPVDPGPDREYPAAAVFGDEVSVTRVCE